MNKNHPHGAPLPDTPTAATEREADDALLQLQPLWEGLCQEVSDTLASNHARPRRVKPEFFQTLRHHRRQVVAHWLLTVCCLFAAVYWAFAMVEYTTCPQVTAAAHLLEVIFILTATYSLHATIRAHQWKEPMMLNNYIPQMTTIVVAMLLFFPFVSHGQLGDGLAITQSGISPFNHAARVETIQTIDNILNGI